jgi:hypothetical protein
MLALIAATSIQLAGSGNKRCYTENVLVQAPGTAEIAPHTV